MKKLTLAVAATVMMAGPALAGDVEAGKAKSMMCSACHGTAGISAVPTYPNLAGQKEAYTAKQLKDFKSGKRNDPTMKGMVAALSDADIANLAAYYASLK
ncbi:MAG: cytochrome c [Colwellia sp.]|nr:cytochrome c [Colwellia sp.]MCW8864774.1 cytochrome c [Colwellia sp.]MCW9081855.1 cytochrome c [Colwellia sp.]